MDGEARFALAVGRRDGYDEMVKCRPHVEQQLAEHDREHLWQLGLVVEPQSIDPPSPIVVALNGLDHRPWLASSELHHVCQFMESLLGPLELETMR